MKNTHNGKTQIILVSSNLEKNIEKKTESIHLYGYGGIAVAIIIAMTGFSTSLMKSLNELIKTLVKEKK